MLVLKKYYNILVLSETIGGKKVCYLRYVCNATWYLPFGLGAIENNYLKPIQEPAAKNSILKFT